jgi:hypothetical protein
MQTKSFLPDHWLLIGIDRPVRSTSLIAQSLLVDLRIDAGQLHTCERVPHIVSENLDRLLAENAGLIRVFAADFDGLREALSQATATLRSDVERILLYHHDLKPEALLSTLSLPENSTWTGWYTGDANAPVRPCKVAPNAWLGAKAMDIGTYEQRWNAAFSIWAHGMLDDIDEEDAFVWYGLGVSEEQENADLTLTPIDAMSQRGKTISAQEQHSHSANTVAELHPTSNEVGARIEREEAGHYVLSCEYPTEAQLTIELKWLEKSKVPTLVELHPKIAMPLLLKVEGGLSNVNADGHKAWRLEYLVKSKASAEELWQDLRAAGQVYVHVAQAELVDFREPQAQQSHSLADMVSDTNVVNESAPQPSIANASAPEPIEPNTNRESWHALNRLVAKTLGSLHTHWWQKLFEPLVQPRMLGSVFVLGVMASVVLLVTQQSDDPSYSIESVRGTLNLAATDATSPEPAAIKELISLKIEVTRVPGGQSGLFELTWPNVPTPEQMAWLQRHNLSNIPPGKQRLQLLQLAP